MRSKSDSDSAKVRKTFLNENRENINKSVTPKM